MFFTACAFTVLCLVSSSLAIDQSCDAVTQPLRREEIPPLYGEWPAVAFTMKINHRKTMLIDVSESFSLHYNNATFLTTKRLFGVCINQPWSAPLKGNTFGRTLRSREDMQGLPAYTTFKGTFHRTSCHDCVLVIFDIASPFYNVDTLTLYSRRREVSAAEMEEFHALAKCLDFPEGVKMDPTIPLCPVTVENFYGSQ